MINNIPLRTLGKSGFQVSESGLGCWQLGGDFGPIDDARAYAILEAALEQGVNFFDTADVYGAGRSETYLGNVLGHEKDIYIATKYGRDGNTYPDKYSLVDLRDSLKRAQDRLKRDVIDLIQLHCIPTAVMEHGAIFEWLRTVQQEGLIKYFGASVETLDEALLCVKQDGLSSLQIIFNIFRQRAKDKLFQQAKERNVGIIVRLPLASGLLSGKYDSQTRFDTSDHRNYNKDGAAFSVGETFSGLPFDKGLEFVGKVQALKPSAMSMTQFALRWILDHEAVTTVIAGASSVEQVVENASATSLPLLSQDVHDKLYALYVNEVEKEIRGVF